MRKKITVVIPTYNRPKRLINCLNALAKQTVPVDIFEVIVVHDGPVVFNTETIERLPLHVALYYTDTKKGPAAARNLGWRKANSDWIAFTDDDCVPDPNWLHAFLLATQREARLACTGQTIVPISETPTDYEQNVAHLATASFITANCILSKKVLMQVGGFDERFKKAFREDSDLEFKLKSIGIPIHAIPTAQVVHPVREAPWGVSLFEQKKGVYDALLYKKFPTLYRQYIRKHPSWSYYIIVCLSVSLLCIPKTYTALLTLNAIVLLILFTRFFIKRIEHTRKSASHIIEMAVTSLFIPYLSVYWKLYGAVKYRVLYF